MIQANEAIINGYYIRELRNQRGLEYNHEFKLTEKEMGSLFSDDILLSLQDLFPIPLTSDILEKCGFQLQPQRQSMYIKGRVKIYLGNSGAISYLKNEDTDECYYIGPCGHLHQLTNLYYALTQKELIVKL